MVFGDVVRQKVLSLVLFLHIGLLDRSCRAGKSIFFFSRYIMKTKRNNNKL